VCSFAPSIASAQDVSGAVQLGLGTPIFEYSDASVEVEFDSLQTENDITTTRWGLGHSVVTEIGYGINDMIVVGGFVELGGTSETDTDDADEETKTSEFNLFLGPKIDVMFSAGSAARPFVGAILGYGTTSIEENPPGMAPTTEYSASGFQFAARGGVRLFAASGLSIDPQLVFGYANLSGDVDAGMTTADLKISGYSIGLSVVFSGWLE
jgi:hypothetical protein